MRYRPAAFVLNASLTVFHLTRALPHLEFDELAARRYVRTEVADLAFELDLLAFGHRTT